MDSTVLADSLLVFADQLDEAVPDAGRLFLLDLQAKALAGFSGGEGSTVTQSTVPGQSFMFQVDVTGADLFVAATSALKSYRLGLSQEGPFDFLGARFADSCFPH